MAENIASRVISTCLTINFSVHNKRKFGLAANCVNLAIHDTFSYCLNATF